MATFSTKEFFEFIKAQDPNREVQPTDGKNCFLAHFAKHKGIIIEVCAFSFMETSEGCIYPNIDRALVRNFTMAFWDYRNGGSCSYGEAKQFIPEAYK